MNIAIILAGGTGSRLGSVIPKQYIEINGKPVIGYCLDKFLENSSVDTIHIVADTAWHDYLKKYIENSKFITKWKGFSKPGPNRQYSILYALEDVLKYASSDDYVMIHDAVRPLINSRFITSCFENVKGHDGLIPVLYMKDTVYYSEDGNRISSLLKRESVVAGQAPEVFLLGKYYEANKVLIPDKILSINGSTEPAILADMDIIMVEGDEENFKITTKEDLERFKQKINMQNGE